MIEENLIEDMEEPTNVQRYDEVEMRKLIHKACRLGKLEMLTSSL